MEPKSALLLVNMGGPANLDEVGDYLRAIFRDPAILPLPSALRFPLANFIAARREDKVKDRYRLIGGRSPLHHWTSSLAKNIEAGMHGRDDETTVSFAFRYSSPTIEEAFTALRGSGVTTVTLLPLFPHYTHAMTGSVVAEAKRVAAKFRMNVRTVSDWGQDEQILDLWSDYLRDAVDQAGPGARVLFVAHGIPQRNVNRGDNYPDRVRATARQLGNRLSNVEWSLAFQSRVGPVKWTGPYLEDELQRVCASPQPLVLIPLSFAADCLETLYDLDIIAAKAARDAGVRKVVRVSAFNDDPRFARILMDLATEKCDVLAG